MPRTAAGQAPRDLRSKRPAQVTARTDPPTDADLLAAEVETETETDDGSVVVTLATDLGKADVTVPPLSAWRSMARNALFSRGDDLFWAQRTLTPEDAQAWMELDPTQAEVQDFFAAWGRVTGQMLGESAAANRASRRMQRR
jgi:hypothetical protein